MADPTTAEAVVQNALHIAECGCPDGPDSEHVRLSAAIVAALRANPEALRALLPEMAEAVDALNAAAGKARDITGDTLTDEVKALAAVAFEMDACIKRVANVALRTFAVPQEGADRG